MITLKTSLRAYAKHPIWIAASALCLLAMTANAQEEIEITEIKPYTYAPEDCEFTATFPSEPMVGEECEDTANKRCFDKASFTKVFDMSASVNVRMTCNKIDKAVYEQYGEDVMKATLVAMTKDSVVTTHNVAFRQGNGYKQAGLVGEGKLGKSDMIYISQMWIGQKSAMTIEAELIGEALPEADEMFSNILRTVGAKSEMENSAKE